MFLLCVCCVGLTENGRVIQQEQEKTRLLNICGLQPNGCICIMVLAEASLGRAQTRFKARINTDAIDRAQCGSW